MISSSLRLLGMTFVRGGLAATSGRGRCDFRGRGRGEGRRWCLVEACQGKEKHGMEEVKGTINKISFFAEDSGYTVARVGGHTVVGTALGGLAVGNRVVLEGNFVKHAKYGKQFVVENCEELDIRDAPEGELKAFLTTLPGVGPATAAKMLATFKAENIIDVLDGDNAVKALTRVNGISKQKAHKMKESWEEGRLHRETSETLQKLGMSLNLATLATKEFGEDCISIIKKDPFTALRGFKGATFRVMDTVASSLKLSKDTDSRIAAAVEGVLAGFARSDGHTYYPFSGLVEPALDILGGSVSREKIWRALSSTSGQGRFEVEGGDDMESARVYLSSLFESEKFVADTIIAKVEREKETVDMDEIDSMLSSFVENAGVELSSSQREAICTAVSQHCLILTGGPGSGKTMVTKYITEVLTLGMKKKVALAAPTGRAAQRFGSVVGMEAMTLHRLLGIDAGRDDNTRLLDKVDFAQTVKGGKGKRRKGGNADFTHAVNDGLLDADVLIIDEASMVDLPLMASVCKCLRHNTCLILVGDADQLPPVGPGAPFQSLLNSRMVPTVRLEHSYRQEASSSIVKHAYDINSGAVPRLEKIDAAWDGSPEYFPTTDFLWVEVDESGVQKRDEEAVAEGVHEVVKTYIPNLFKGNARYNPDKIQVLSPGKRYDAGTGALNTILQPLQNIVTLKEKRHNPDLDHTTLPSHESASGKYFVGDRVMQLENDYEKGRYIFNGDMGYVVQINTGDCDLLVRYPTPVGDNASFLAPGHRFVKYQGAQLNDLLLGWCITVHKSQGGEYPYVVIALPPSASHFTTRRLLYTAVTRARELCILVSTRAALEKAVRARGHIDRYTWLDARIRKSNSSLSRRDVSFPFRAQLQPVDTETGDITAAMVEPGFHKWTAETAFRLCVVSEEDCSVVVLSVSTDNVDIAHPLEKDGPTRLVSLVAGMIPIRGGPGSEVWQIDESETTSVLVFASREQNLHSRLDLLKTLTKSAISGAQEAAKAESSDISEWLKILEKAAGDEGVLLRSFVLEACHD